MQNDIIKNSSANNINEEKEEINKKQLEESQKKTIEELSSLEKMLNEGKENLPHSHISLKDHSKRIKYDEIKGNSAVTDNSSSESSYNQTIVTPHIPINHEEKISYDGNASSRKPFDYNDIASGKIINDRGNTENVIKTNDNAGGVIRTNESSIIKDNSKNYTAENKKTTYNNRPNRLKDAYKERVNQKYSDNSQYQPKNGYESYSDNGQYQTESNYDGYSDNRQYQTESNYDGYSDNRQYQTDSSYDGYSDNRQYQTDSSYDGYSNNRPYQTESEYSNRYSDNQSIENSVIRSSDNKAFTYNDRNADVNIKSNRSDIDYRHIDVSVKPETSQILTSEVAKGEKSKYAEINRKNQIKAAYKAIQDEKDKQNNSSSFEYVDDTYAKQDIRYIDNISQNQEVKYIDDAASELKNNGVVLDDIGIEAVIKQELSKAERLGIKEQSDTIISEESEIDLKKFVERNERLKKLGIKEKSVIIKTNESKYKETAEQNSRWESFIRQKDKNNPIKESSEFNTSDPLYENNPFINIAENGLAANSITEKIRGDKRNLSLNKADISKKAEMLGIKKESADSIKESITQYNKDTKKSAISITSYAKRGIRNMIAEHSDDDIVMKSADATIRVYESGKFIYRTSAKVADLGKEIITTPKEITKSAKILKARLRKAQKFMRMSRANKFRYTKVYVKNAVNNTVAYITDIAVKTAKSLAVKVIGAGFAALLLIIVISSAVLIILTSFMWQTTSDLDTTQMVKYIAELDYDEQKKWFTQGKTNVEIADSNERGSKRSTPMSYEYHYLLAVDVPPEVGVEENVVSTGAIKCSYSTGFDSSGKKLPVSYSGFNKEFDSSDAMLEEYRWTTDDYFAALAYLQVKNDNLGWFTSLFGWVGKAVLKSSMDDLHEATYKQEIVHKETKNGNSEYSFDTPICSTTYTDTNNTKSYYFGRKYSVKYLIDNDMIRFDDDDEENKKQKEQFERVYRYGNIAVSNLAPPLELEDGEDISDRIVKHFGKQLYLTYEPPEPPSHSGDIVYGKVTEKAGYHYAIDLKADSGDIILAPISGLCKARQRDGRGYEYSICTALNDDGTDFDFTKKGYLVKISCSSTSFIPTSVAMKVNKGTSWLGYVADSSGLSVNYEVPDMDNDTENEDIFAKKLFPCFTGTDFQSIDSNDYDIPHTKYDHIHMEMYKLPCDFSNKNDIEENVLDPELFFPRQAEDE